MLEKMVTKMITNSAAVQPEHRTPVKYSIMESIVSEVELIVHEERGRRAATLLRSEERRVGKECGS